MTATLLLSALFLLAFGVSMAVLWDGWQKAHAQFNMLRKNRSGRDKAGGQTCRPAYRLDHAVQARGTAAEQRPAAVITRLRAAA